MINLSLNQFCVYSHSVNGVVFYVGHGKCERPFCLISRNRPWMNFIKGKKTLEVTLHSWHRSKKEALKFELELIKKLKPKCNISYNKVILPKAKRFHVDFINSIDSWLKEKNIESIELAKILDVSPSTISKWRVRKSIPKRHQTILKNILGLSRQSLQWHQRPSNSGPF